MKKSEEFMAVTDQQLQRRHLNQDSLKIFLPRMTLNMVSGKNNPVANYLTAMGYSLNELKLNLNADPEIGLNGGGHIYTMNAGGILLDTIQMHIFQDTTGVKMDGRVRNGPKNKQFVFESRLNAYLHSTGAGINLIYLDDKRKKGVDLGLRADVQDNGIKIVFSQIHPIIAYRKFDINEDNYIFLGNDRRVEADVNMLADDGTGARIYSTPNPEALQDLSVNLNHVNLKELTAVIPYAPRISGLMQTDAHLIQTEENLSVVADVSVKDMAYEDAPLGNIGLIVMDEEQESSYESETAPCYHARDIAKYRCLQEGARLLLGSATPTVETAYWAEKGDYQKALLRQRYNRQALPAVILADLRQELLEGRNGIISRPLYDELQKNLAAGEQSILFLNRRGSSRQLLCPQCTYVPKCPRCSVYLTYHSANGRLMCHYCGYSVKAPEVCPECGGRFKHIGVGTQRVEEELHTLFPDTPLLRMDADTVSVGHETILREFEEKRVPILLGTQMVAKGLDFENVTLVGVLDADLSLYVQNYHAAERTYSLLAQVVGRAGRGERAGRAVIQTYHPDNEVIQAAAKQDYEAFYRNELRLRRLRRYPPFADLFTLTVSGRVEMHVIAAACALRDALRAASEKEPLRALETEVLGPAGAPVVKVNDRYRYCVYLSGRSDSALRRTVSEYLLAFSARKENRGLDIFADCNALQ